MEHVIYVMFIPYDASNDLLLLSFISYLNRIFNLVSAWATYVATQSIISVHGH